ncbi:MAG: hypothetical protein J5994_05680 [Ruminococcus sp.]|nr:hypothetical protein [Ruminococcus sp.]
MSIEKNVEDMYRSDAEKRKKNRRKKKRKNILTLLLVVIFIAAVLLLMKGLGLGPGWGKGNDSSGSASSSADGSEEKTTTSVADTTTEEPKEFIGIKVSGSTYIYRESEFSLEDLVETFRLMSDNVVVMITDDNATQNAMEALTSSFEESGREFIIISPDDSQAPESQPDTVQNTVTTLIP